MAGLTTKVLVGVLVCLVVVALCSEAKEQHPRKLKKYNPAVDAALAAKKSYRSPRQAERRQYYPCISCFKVGSREICTSPFCPDNYQCDRSSKRCHKKANIRGRPETPPAEEVDPPAES